MPGGGSLNPPSVETLQKRMHYVHQDGRQVFKYAVRKGAETALELLERNGFQSSDVALLVAHQANSRIIDATADRLNIPQERVLKNIHKFGNTTAATIPLVLWDAHEEGKLKKGDLVLVWSVGAGFTIGCCLIRWTGLKSQ
jgi:3-oxoacyl-[acyl-carrier-protein] synthase-3